MTPSFVRGLMRKEGVRGLIWSQRKSNVRTAQWRFFPNHVLPPLFLNALVGFTLFYSYSTTSTLLAPSLSPHSPLIPFIAGSVAGAAQSLISAPLDNARLLLLRRQRLLRQFTRTSHSRLARHHALAASKPFRGWWELLRDAVVHSPSASPLAGTPSEIALSPEARRKVAMTRARDWARRGWSLWGLSLSKDAVSFGVFFSIFEWGRKVARGVGLLYDGISEADYAVEEGEDDFAWDTAAFRPKRSKASLALQGFLILVAGGLAGFSFSVVARPFERARGAIWEGRARWAEQDGRLRVAEVLGESSVDAEAPKRPRRVMRRKVARERGIGRTFAVARRREQRKIDGRNAERAEDQAVRHEERRTARKALELLPTKTREPLPSASSLVRLATSKHGAFTFLFAPLPVLQARLHSPPPPRATPIRRPALGPSRLSARRNSAAAASTPLWRRAGKILTYVPPYAVGLLAYALFSGDMS